MMVTTTQRPTVVMLDTYTQQLIQEGLDSFDTGDYVSLGQNPSKATISSFLFMSPTVTFDENDPTTYPLYDPQGKDPSSLLDSYYAQYGTRSREVYA
jgi:hypothetical protein